MRAIPSSPCPKWPGRSKRKAYGRRSSNWGTNPCGDVSRAGSAPTWGAAYSTIRSTTRCASPCAMRTGWSWDRPSIMPGRTDRSVRCSTGSSTPVRNCWPTNPPQRWSFAAGAGRVRRSTGWTNIRLVAVLEQRARTAARRGGAGCRRIADDAGVGTQHGAAAQGRPARFGGAA